MIAQLEKIKDYLLATISEFNQGFANVSKPDGTDFVIDDNGIYRGISDQHGNYFYLRSLKESRYSKYQRNSLQKTTSCRIVSILETDEETHLMVILDALSNGCQLNNITRSVTEKTQVFFEETGTRNINNWLNKVSLLSVDFDVTEIVSTKNCKPQICKC
jgi:hypothetical protein